MWHFTLDKTLLTFTQLIFYQTFLINFLHKIFIWYSASWLGFAQLPNSELSFRFNLNFNLCCTLSPGAPWYIFPAWLRSSRPPGPALAVQGSQSATLGRCLCWCRCWLQGWNFSQKLPQFTTDGLKAERFLSRTKSETFFNVKVVFCF